MSPDHTLGEATFDTPDGITPLKVNLEPQPPAVPVLPPEARAEEARQLFAAIGSEAVLDLDDLLRQRAIAQAEKAGEGRKKAE